MKWPTTTISTPDGQREAIAPQVISASRSTDIPAFHAEWLRRRLLAGYCKWVNPFNRRVQYVSFERARAFVFWTKNPEPLIPHLGTFDRKGITYYFQFALNDYEAERLEPNVPPLGERIRTFGNLSQLIGKERVVWRFDPLLLADSITPADLVRKVQRIGDLLHRCTQKLVISFADISAYAKVARNLKTWRRGAREFSDCEIREVAARIAEMAARWGITVATCCEQMDLSSYGIEHNKCVDDALLLRISHEDPVLIDLLRPRRHSRLFVGSASAEPRAPKDGGQREACGCVVSKDIGAYNTCGHLCRYCYANGSEAAVRNVIAHLAPTDEALCP